MIPIKYEGEEGWGYITKALVDKADEQKNWNRELSNYLDGQTHTWNQGYQYRRSQNFPMTCKKVHNAKFKHRDAARRTEVSKHLK